MLGRSSGRPLSIYAIFVFLLSQLCLLSKNMKPALPLLDTDITEISQEVKYASQKNVLPQHMSYQQQGLENELISDVFCLKWCEMNKRDF